MDENSAKSAQTRNQQVSSLHLALAWLDREGRQQRHARALQGLIEATLIAMSRGDPPPEKDTNTLREILQLDVIRPGTASKSFRAAELATWWEARAEQLRQFCSGQGCPWTPQLVVKTGGGRGLPSRLSFEFRLTGEAEPDAGAI